MKRRSGKRFRDTEAFISSRELRPWYCFGRVTALDEITDLLLSDAARRNNPARQAAIDKGPHPGQLNCRSLAVLVSRRSAISARREPSLQDSIQILLCHSRQLRGQSWAEPTGLGCAVN